MRNAITVEGGRVYTEARSPEEAGRRLKRRLAASGYLMAAEASCAEQDDYLSGGLAV